MQVTHWPPQRVCPGPLHAAWHTPFTQLCPDGQPQTALPPAVPKHTLAFGQHAPPISVKSGLHSKPHTPLVQVRVAFVTSGQSAAVQQFAVGMHWLLHLLKPGTQSKPHTPPTQVVVALGTLGQATLQAPQLFTLVFLLTHCPT